jgi:hypothetical protein
LNRLLPTVAIACVLVSACAPNRNNNVLVNGNLIAGAGGNVISAGGGNVVSAGGGNLIGQAGGNMTASASAKTPAKANPFGLPTTVRLALPAALGGAGVVAAGGANYRTQELPAPDALAKGVRDNTEIYTRTTALIDEILKGVSQLELQPGRSVTFADPAQKGHSLTVLLEVKSDHAVISVGTGKAAKGATQVFAMRYNSPRKGHAVFHIEDAAPEGRIHLATDFDLDAQKASADGAFDTAERGGSDHQKSFGHWEFSQTKTAEADEVAFSMAGSVHVDRPEGMEEDGVLAFAANFLPDGRGAFLFGVQNAATGNRFVFLPRDGVSYFSDPPAAHDFYMTAAGADLAKTGATPALRAIAPPDTAIHRPFPAHPGTQDPFEDARFDFPE